MKNDKEACRLFGELNDTLFALLGPGGCQWDKAQTHESLIKNLREESQEVIDAIENKDDENLCEELGDVLLQVVFHAAIAEEQNRFSIRDVINGINQKLIRRHPHVFGGEKAATADDVAKLWQKIKAAEAGHRMEKKSLMDEVKPCLSVLDRAEKLQKTAAKTGFDWNNAGQVLDKIAEETAEVREAMAENDDEHIDEELGDLLFAVVNLIRFRGKTHASELLRRANLKFENRFRQLEKEFAALNEDISGATAARMDQLWEKVKADSRNL